MTAIELIISILGLTAAASLLVKRWGIQKILFLFNIAFFFWVYKSSWEFGVFQVLVTVLSYYACRIGIPLWHLILFNLASFLAVKWGNISIDSFIIPLGYSFYSLRIFSFLLDRQRNPVVKDWSFREYIGYVYFFPQFAAGPILKAKDFYTHVRRRSIRNKYVLFSTCFLVGIGLIKKLVISDRLLPLVEIPIAYSSEHRGLALLFVAVLSKYLIFLDFSAYSDIARGLSRFLGFNTPINFNRPFYATSMRDFWRRWHSTLSSFINEYVYQPLLVSPLRKAPFIFIFIGTYLALALWHKLTLPFLIYGVVQAFLLYFDRKIFPDQSFIGKPLALFVRRLVLYVFCLALPSLVFRVESLDQLSTLYVNMLSLETGSLNKLFELIKYPIWPLVGAIIAYEVAQSRWTQARFIMKMYKLNYAYKVLFVFVVVLFSIYFAQLDKPTAFIYSQF